MVFLHSMISLTLILAATATLLFIPSDAHRLILTSPESSSTVYYGNYGDFIPALDCQAGGNNRTLRLVAGVTAVTPGSGQLSGDGCRPYNATVQATWGTSQYPVLLVIDRGACTFMSKLSIAQAAGAVGVLVIDTVGPQAWMGFTESNVFPTSLMGNGIDLQPLDYTVAGVMVSGADGASVRNAMAQTSTMGLPLLARFDVWDPPPGPLRTRLPILIIDTRGCDRIIEFSRRLSVLTLLGGTTTNSAMPPVVTMNSADRVVFPRAGVGVRGFSTATGSPKKNLAISIWDNSNMDRNVVIMDMPSGSDWVLGGDVFDRTIIRNHLIYTLYRNMTGRYAPRGRHVELLLKEDNMTALSMARHYQGVYNLLEKIKRDNLRVNISRNEPSSLDVSGGYILKVDHIQYQEANVTKFYSNTTSSEIIFEYPDPKVVTSSQMSYITSFVNEFEAVLYGPNYNNTSDGYQKYIDVACFIDYLLLGVELPNNADGLKYSTYMYKDKFPGKLCMGPLWDYNNAFGQASVSNAWKTYGWRYTYNNVRLPWYSRLAQDPTFVQATIARWRQLRQGSLTDKLVADIICGAYQRLNDSMTRNNIRWPVMGHFLWQDPLPVPKTYDEAVVMLHNWTLRRMHWMDANIQSIGVESMPSFEDQECRCTETGADLVVCLAYPPCTWTDQLEDSMWNRGPENADTSSSWAPFTCNLTQFSIPPASPPPSPSPQVWGPPSPPARGKCIAQCAQAYEVAQYVSATGDACACTLAVRVTLRISCVVSNLDANVDLFLTSLAAATSTQPQSVLILTYRQFSVDSTLVDVGITADPGSQLTPSGAQSIETALLADQFSLGPTFGRVYIESVLVPPSLAAPTPKSSPINRNTPPPTTLPPVARTSPSKSSITGQGWFYAVVVGVPLAVVAALIGGLVLMRWRRGGGEREERERDIHATYGAANSPSHPLSSPTPVHLPLMATGSPTLPPGGGLPKRRTSSGNSKGIRSGPGLEEPSTSSFHYDLVQTT